MNDVSDTAVTSDDSCNMSGMSRATSTLASSSPSGHPNSTGHVAWQQPRRICSLTLHLNDSLADELPVLAIHAIITEVIVCNVAFILNVSVVAVGGLEAFILIYVLGILLTLI